MKRFTFTLISLLLIGFLLYGKSWKMTYSSHGLIENEINNMKLTDYVDPGLPGYNQTWDFTDLAIKKDFKGTIDKSAYSEHYTKLFNTNVVLKEFSNEFFFKGDKNSLELHGVATNGKLYTKYEKPFVKMKYPFKYGDSFSGNYFGEYFTGNTSRDINGNYSVTADGYGTLVLPNNVELNNVLRVTTIRSYTRGTSKTVITHNTTRFYVQNMRFPVLVLIKNEYNTGTKKSYSYQAAYNNKIDALLQPTAIENEISTTNLNIYPIPSNDVINIEYSLNTKSKMNIELYNVIGEKVFSIKSENQEPGTYNIPFSFKENGLPASTYYIKFDDGNKQYTKKVIAQ